MDRKSFRDVPTQFVKLWQKITSQGYINNYIDDLISIGLPSRIHKFYKFEQQLLADLGLDISSKEGQKWF